MCNDDDNNNVGFLKNNNNNSGLSPSSGKYLSSSVDLYNSLVDPQDSLTPESVGNSHLSQKVLSSKIEDRQFSNLFHSATLTDRARLLSISSSHTSAWLFVTPSPLLNLHLEPAEFQVALKWWLGIPVVQGQSCPHCPSFVLDDFGHHSLSCKHGGDVYRVIISSRCFFRLLPMCLPGSTSGDGLWGWVHQFTIPPCRCSYP